MAVNDVARQRRLDQIALLGHPFRRVGFGASRDELEAAQGRIDSAERLFVVEHSRHMMQVYERVNRT